LTKFKTGDRIRIKNRGDGWDGLLCEVQKESWNEGFFLRALENPPIGWPGYGKDRRDIGSWGVRYYGEAEQPVDETEAFFV